MGCAKVMIQAGVKRIVYYRDIDIPMSKVFLKNWKLYVNYKEIKQTAFSW